MSQTKKKIREKFREAVFLRDHHACRICGSDNKLDAHHITNRNYFKNGGYVLENGITLCAECHLKAENLEFKSEELYEIIGSSFGKAERKDQCQRFV